MKGLLRFICFLCSLVPSAISASELAHHELKVSLTPSENRLTAVDTITLPADSPPEVQFTLHAGLNPVSPTPLVRIENQGQVQGGVPLESYKIVLPAGLRSFVVRYEGVVYHPVSQTGKEQARGFEETPGVVSNEGVFLSKTSLWYPNLGPDPTTFDLEVKLPAAWEAISQGERIIHDHGDNMTMVRWKSPEPQEELFLIAGKFIEYSKPAGRVQAMVFLRSSDEKLANKYLTATAEYLNLYSGLIGPYPYKKFALVENFWETGFGMPSFTLLGPKVVRLPFIINSSYPHEILHNWWGNSVFPAYEQGNWSEGLTAYLADHLIKEQQGGGADYRVNTLQKYADYVQDSRDFPLTQFISRHSQSSEAIGYGKSLMFFHMLRQELGDPAFKDALRRFYRQHRFGFASFWDIRASFEAAAGRDLRQEFDQWVVRTGAPELEVKEARIVTEDHQTLLIATLEQTQPGEVYHLRLPAAVTMENKEKALQTIIDMKERKQELRIPVPAHPMRLDIDPEFDLFRRLDREEIPPAISQALGAKNMLIILPSNADKRLLEAYRSFAEVLGRSGPDEVEIKLDSRIKTLPLDRSITLIGWENRFLKEMLSTVSVYGVASTNQSILINQTSVARKDHSFVLSARVPGNSKMGMLFIASDYPEALPGLGRKLPHYHKYSYLAFEGNEPANVAKGRWPVLNSPLTAFLPDREGDMIAAPMAKLEPRVPLASSAPVFSRDRMLDAVRLLSSEDYGGRGFGSPELDKAADHLARQFKDAGLRPGGTTEESWFQVWDDRGGDPARNVIMKNVIGIIPGKNADMAGQSVVIGAHYDHLGLGWPESRDKADGRIHPGADDNASGVAVLMELARALASGPKPERTIIFIAFAGEETGKMGSRHYAAQPGPFPLNKCIGMVNLDTVGRLGKRKLLVLGAGSAREWVHIFRGAGFVTNVELETVSVDLDSSDQKSFQEAGVPAVQLFSGPHLDYHRSTDTADKIDGDGLVKVAAVAKEVVDYLAERPDPLTAAGKPMPGAAQTSDSKRKVSLGTIPDFAYAGKGFRLSGVVEGSSAEAIGLMEGDVIVRMNATDIESLTDYSNFLKTLKPGDQVTITFRRENREMTVGTAMREK